MTSHTGRTYLNSCLKVPIDPCNNCPAPIYNRPKMYFGRLSTTTPMSSNVTKLTGTQTKDSIMDLDSIWTSHGVRSLAQFYDSIPDYCDINHLPEEEFYSTLDSLKTTCREFKTKTLEPCIIDDRSNSSSTVSTLCTSSSTIKSKKSSKKKSKNGSKKKSNQPKELHAKVCVRSAAVTPCTINYKNCFIDQMRLKSYKEDFKDEIEDLKKTLKDFELRRPASVKRSQKKPKICLEANVKERSSAPKNEEHICITRPTSRTTSRQAHLKKSYSFNDIHSIEDSSNDDDFKPNDQQPNRLKHKLTKAEMSIHKDRNKLSNYFMPKSKKDSGKERCSSATAVPKIIVGSPSMANNFSPNSGNDNKHAMGTIKGINKLEIPLNEFSSNYQSKKDKRSEQSSPSPVHPVARPNLAATLRAKVGRKKVMELENNCTYHDDATPPNDWEVRKTPAWKSLALNESHKDIIALRLATRKAEQKLQQREYDLNMELMRQRVKSAPLLLEGVTYWGFNVGKLTHSCQQAGIKHLCQHQKQRKQRRKIASERRSLKGDVILENRAESAASNNKYHKLRTIYASSTQSCSRNSRRCAGSQPKQPESGDDLSTGDRAYL